MTQESYISDYAQTISNYGSLVKAFPSVYNSTNYQVIKNVMGN